MTDPYEVHALSEQDEREEAVLSGSYVRYVSTDTRIEDDREYHYQIVILRADEWEKLNARFDRLETLMLLLFKASKED